MELINLLGMWNNPYFLHFRYLFGACDVIPVFLRSISFLVSIRIMSFSSLRDPSGRTNIAARSDFNFTLRGIDVIEFAQEVQDLRIGLIPTPRSVLSRPIFLYVRNISNNNKKNSAGSSLGIFLLNLLSFIFGSTRKFYTIM